MQSNSSLAGKKISSTHSSVYIKQVGGCQWWVRQVSTLALDSDWPGSSSGQPLIAAIRPGVVLAVYRDDPGSPAVSAESTHLSN
jgi:hypothetical protein